MSTLEKFGILVILILVVIIGVVAVWGVGGNEGANPFETPRDGSAVVAPSGDLPPWPSAGPGPDPVAKETAPPVVAPPVVEAPVTPASPPALAGNAPPAPAGDGTSYVVVKGDTLTKIAERTLGDGNKWTLIRDANPGKDPKRLKIGDTLQIPGAGGVAKAPAAPRPPVNTFSPNPDDGPTGAAPAVGPEPTASGMREVVVEQGDSFFKLAERYLGDGNLYGRIVKANPGIDPRRLRPGMKVLMPAAE